MSGFPTVRPRRLRRTEQLRRMVSETRLSPADFIYPLFVVHGQGIRSEIPSMPGNYHLSPDMLSAEVDQLLALGIPGVLLFGLPAAKDEYGTEAYAEEGIVQQATKVIKRAAPAMLVVTDVCLCEYTSHGHCGVLVARQGGVEVDNDSTLELLARTALSQAAAGADIVAPSDMMDGRVSSIRRALDEQGFTDTAIMAYSAKYASAFYGPFRAAADSAPQAGDRHGYQMDPANVLEALREVEMDVEEGADVVMVKPALSYLDVIARVKARFPLPVAAYNVSGEYSMVKAAAQRGWIDGDRVAMEIVTSIKRAGADIIITYHAKEIAAKLRAM